jgi:dolichyl-phosphate-mannose--protein O-mannosyl transferase
MEKMTTARHEQTTPNRGQAGHWALLVAVVSFATRLVWLGWPPVAIGDEAQWFGQAVNSYVATGERTFNIHPPLPQMLMAAFLLLTGYRGEQYFPIPLDIYAPTTVLVDISPFAMRLLPALVGAMIPLLVFFILRHVKVQVRAAGVSALFLALDTGFVVRARMMGRYSFLLAALLAAMYCALKARDTVGAKKMLLLIACGLSLGLAVGSQWVGLAGVVVVVVILRGAWRETALVAICAMAAYLVIWKLHFVLLPNVGFGDLYVRHTGAFWADLIGMHTAMYRANASMTAAGLASGVVAGTLHGNLSSPPWAWPFMTVCYPLWVRPLQAIAFVGNPATWVGVTLVALWYVCSTPRRPCGPHAYYERLFLVAFVLSYLPLVVLWLHGRLLHSHSFLMPLLFLVLYVGVAAEAWIAARTPWLIALLLLGFIALSPLTYALVAPAWYWQMLPW